MPTDYRPETDEHDEPTEVERAIVEYLEQLNAGERVDPWEILAAHPGIGQEILDGLQSFIDLDSSQRPEPGRTLGDYTLRRQIGRGGMGVVYEAWQSSMDRRVALKVLPPGVAADNRAFTRFMREAKTAGQLSHQNIVAVYSTGVEEGTPWYSMEYVEGETLARVLARLKDAGPDAATPFGFTREDQEFYLGVARAFADVADGLQHAHSKGVVHRDIKPSNLIFDADARLRVLDFGLARLEGEESLTGSGDLMGTVLYMSPEQAMAKRIPLDHRTDVYSVGATMYETLTGAPPFRGGNQHDTLSQIIAREPRPPRQLNSRVPTDLETIVLKCLRKDPADRYGTAEALAQDLRRFVRGDPIEARPQPAWEKLARRISRNRRRFAALAAMVLLAALSGWLAVEFFNFRRQAEEERYRTVVLEAAASLFRGEMVLWARFERASGIGGATKEGGNGSEAERLLTDVVERLRSASRTAQWRVEVHYYRARGLRHLERYSEALSEANLALQYDPDFVPATILREEIEQALGRGTRPVRQPAGKPWADAWLRAFRAMRRINWAEADAAYDELIELEEAGETFYLGASTEMRLGRGMALLQLKQFELAKRDFWLAHGRSRSCLEPLLLLGRTFCLEGKPEVAAEHFEELHAHAEESEKDETARWIALVYRSVADTEAAMRWVQRIDDGFSREFLKARLLVGKERIDVLRKVIREYPRQAHPRVELGWALLEDLLRTGRWRQSVEMDEVEELARSARELDETSRAARWFLARVLYTKGEHDEAQELLEGSEIMNKVSLMVVPVLVSGVVEAQQGSFTDVRPLGPEVNRGFAVDESLSPDGLKLFFGSHAIPGGRGDRDIWMAERDSKGEPFGMTAGSVTLVAEVSTPGFDSAHTYLSTDELELYYVPGGTASADIFVRRREARDAPWGERVLLGNGINSQEHDLFPTLSADGLTLYFVRGPDNPGGGYTNGRIFIATRESTEGDFDDVKELIEVSENFANVGSPSPSRDELVLFFDDNAGNIWMMTREDKGDEFADPVQVGPGVVSNGTSGRPAISHCWPADGSEIFFSRGTPKPGGGLEWGIWVATWVCEDDCPEAPPPPGAGFRRGDCDADGGVNVTDAVCALNFLFGGAAAPGCRAAINVNGDDLINIADPVALLNFLFGGGAEPPAPYSECGPGKLPADKTLGCAEPHCG